MVRGRREYEVAEQLPADGYERPRWWLAAAHDYDAAFRDAPTIDDAPEAALNGAYAYRQAGEHAKAIEMYELFIASYGSESILALLQNGDAQAEPPIAANARRYDERVQYVGIAYQDCSEALVALGKYQRAAEILETASKNARFAEAWRRAATQKAQSLREMAARPTPVRP